MSGGINGLSPNGGNPRTSVSGSTKRLRPQHPSQSNHNLSSQHKSHQHQRKGTVLRTSSPHTNRHPSSLKREGQNVTSINFSKLDTGSLRKYRRHYKLAVGPNSNKDQLVHAVRAHFLGQSVDEGHVLAGFILALHGASSQFRHGY